MVTYLTHHVDKSLRVASSEMVNYISRLPVREDCLDKRTEFILGNGVANQTL